MRKKIKAFLSCTVVAAALLLAAPRAMATGTCTFNPDIMVVSAPPGAPVGTTGACFVADADVASNPTCKTNGEWTGIKYKTTGVSTSDLIATLVTVNNTVSPNQIRVFPVPSGSVFYPAGTVSGGGGDPNTGLGKYSAHEQAIKVKLSADGTFWVLVKGNKQPVQTSIAMKKSGLFCPVKTFQRLGLGLDVPEGCVSTCGNFNPKQAVKNSQIFRWEGCEFMKMFDSTTGSFLGVQLTENSDPACRVDKGEFQGDGPQPVTDLQLGGEAVTFADGDATTGDNSCYTTLVGGRYARVCKP